MAVAAVAGVLCFSSALQTRTVTATGSVTSQWWKLLAIGIGGVFAMILAEGATDLSLWMPMIITVLFSLVLIAAGLVLGVAHVFVTYSHRAAS